MSVQLLFVRHAIHAEVGRILTGRGADIPLTVKGMAQAERLGQALVERPVAAIHSSPQRRCCETADILARHLKLPVQIIPALDEIDFGAWTGMAFPELEQEPLWRMWNIARSKAAPPGGEAMTAAVQRTIDHIAKLVAGSSQTILCVSHCDIIRGAVAHYLGLGLDNVLRFDVDPASLSEMIVGSDWARLITLNRTYA